jgi:hypothetical protein
MQYEKAILCNACTYSKSEGSLSEAPSLMDAQVLQEAGHNSRCPVPNVDQRKIRIESNQEIDTENEQEVTKVRYAISIVGQSIALSS